MKPYSSEIISIHLPNEEATRKAGASLVHTLYSPSLTILLSGELGAGKTTFMQGFLREFGVEGRITSPTFALEERYTTNRGTILHCDLYRLSTKQAEDFLFQNSEFDGIQCIEWPERLEKDIEGPTISVHLDDADDGRNLTVTFSDFSVPTEDNITQWQTQLLLPHPIARHCKAVRTVGKEVAETMVRSGKLARPLLAQYGGYLHDLLRFFDFQTHSYEEFGNSKEELECWNTWKEKYGDVSHEKACALFLEQEGYPVLAEIVATHGLRDPLPQSTEQKIVYYADKLCIEDKITTLEERFSDFGKRYKDTKKAEDRKKWFAYAQKIEKELLN